MHKLKMEILVINYYWPPAGGPAVQRWVNMLNEWTAAGVICHLVTVDSTKATYQVLDNSIGKQVNSGINIYKTDTAELFGLYRNLVGQVPANAFVNERRPSFKQKIARFMRGNFFIPDPRKGWNKFAYRAAVKIIQSHDVKILVTAGPPHSTHLIGLKIKKITNITWIADLHDYWTDIFYLKEFYRTPPARWIDRHLELKVLKSADLVLSHCQFAKQLYVKKLKNLNADKILIHTMGFDNTLFQPDRKPEPQSVFTVTYTGMMPGNFDPEIFFRVMGRIVSDYPEIPVKIRFVGLFSQTVRSFIKKYELEKCFEETGYVEHSKIPVYLYSSSLLLLVNPHVRNEKMIVPGKIYEYLAVRKPVISIAGNDSENARLLELCEAGRNFERNDDETMYSYLKELLKAWQIDHHVDLTNNNRNYLKFSRSYEARRLLEKITRMTGSGS